MSCFSADGRAGNGAAIRHQPITKNLVGLWIRLCRVWRDAMCMDSVRRSGELAANVTCGRRRRSGWSHGGRRRSPVVTVGRAIKDKAYQDIS
jgi:hypothetical protein